MSPQADALYRQVMGVVEQTVDLEREDYLWLMSKLTAHISAHMYSNIEASNEELGHV